MTDELFMRHALNLAKLATGTTAPNPAVGCVIESNGAAIGRGWTLPPGQAHAEIVALREAAAQAEGATAYVTLEPCAHIGRTPPCVESLIAAGIRRVVAACRDPDPRVSGKGLQRLAGAGIAVSVGCLADEAIRANRGFFSRVCRSRPWITIKSAMSIDGRVATSSGSSRWISRELSRAYVHQLRAETDAVLVGVGTIIADDPRLTSRRTGHNTKVPWRVIADSHLRIARSANVLSDDHVERTILLTTVLSDQIPDELKDAGCRFVVCPKSPTGRIDLAFAMEALAQLGVNSVLTESGGALATSLMAQQLVDELCIIRAPIIIGGDGRPAFGPLNVLNIDDALRLTELVDRMQLEGDLVERYFLPTGSSLISEQKRLSTTQFRCETAKMLLGEGGPLKRTIRHSC